MVFRISPSLHQSTMIFSPRDGKMIHQQIPVHSYPIFCQSPEFGFRYMIQAILGAQASLLFVYLVHVWFCKTTIISLSYLCILADLICIAGFCRNLEAQTDSACTLCLLGYRTTLGGFQSFGLFRVWIEDCKFENAYQCWLLTLFCGVLLLLSLML